MSERWRVLDLMDFAGQIQTSRGHLIIDDNDVPVSDVSCILTGTRTHWTGSATHLAARHGIILVSCDWKGLPISITFPWSTNSRVATRHHQQAQLSQPRRKNAWKQIVQAKILGQAANLSPPGSTHLHALARKVRSGDPQNIEAQAAKTYWRYLFSEGPFKRSIEMADRNALLNYGYTILRGHVMRCIVAAGLHPTLGIFHHHRSNAFGLADDLMEPFRPCIDHCVTTMPPNATLDQPETKHSLVEATATPIASGHVSVLAAINDLCQAFALYCEGTHPTLSVPTWNPCLG